MSRSWLVFGIIALAGCSQGDPAATILPAGSEAVVVGETASHLEDSDDWIAVDPGSRVRIGYDSGVYQETGDVGSGRYEAPDPLSGYRRVRVVVESGPHQGKSGTLYRNDLRPIR